MQYTDKSILVVSPDVPFPTTHGGRVDIWGRIRALRELGFNVDLLFTCSDEVAHAQIVKMQEFVASVHVIRRRNRIRHVLSFNPLQYESRRGLATCELNREYDVLLLETEYVAPVLENRSVKARHIILRAQNNEEQYMKALSRSTSNVWKRAFYISEALKFKWLTRRVVQSVSQVWFISRQDFDAAAQCRVSKGRSQLVLPPVNIEPFQPSCTVELCVLFVGSLFMPNNIHGLKWYVENVHPRLLDIKGYRFVIVGSSKGDSLADFRKFLKGYDKIDLHCDVDDLGAVYGRSRVFVNPMQEGAGVKLKTINALAAGLPVVSTSIGNEGTGLEPNSELLVADTPLAFSEHIRTLLMNSALGKVLVEHAQDKLRRDYDHVRTLEGCFEKLLVQEPEQQYEMVDVSVES